MQLPAPKTIQQTKVMDPSASEYTIQPLEYPADTHSYLAALVDAFSKDPNTIYLYKHIKNPQTMELRKHMREAKFRNTIEGLNEDATSSDTIFAKIVHTPSNTIAGISSWTFPTKCTPSQTPKANRTPYPLLPLGIEIPAEDAAISTLGPRLEERLERYVETIPLLGTAESRNKQWWYLAMLGIIPTHSGKRLGARLVEQGLALAREDAQQRPELGIKGAWLTSTEAGLKTYENVGFQHVGLCRVVYGESQREGQGLDLDVVELTERTQRMPGQMCYVLAIEF